MNVKSMEPHYDEIMRELAAIENEAGIQFNRDRKRIARYLISHFTKEHLPPPVPEPPKFEIPEELKE